MRLDYNIDGELFSRYIIDNTNAHICILNIGINNELSKQNIIHKDKIVDIKLYNNNGDIYIISNNKTFEFKSYKEYKSFFGIN